MQIAQFETHVQWNYSTNVYKLTHCTKDDSYAYESKHLLDVVVAQPTNLTLSDLLPNFQLIHTT